jgi:hypothetical protein
MMTEEIGKMITPEMPPHVNWRAREGLKIRARLPPCQGH